ncbi:MAG: HAD-IIA family hydrolase [Actinobacteria bacterium]|nr:HAD-IIA family hydrolase [Actinomycetota bacterium]
MPLSDDFDGFLVDLDGVVWIGREPVPGSPEALAALLAAGKELVFVTNNPGREPAAYAERLAALGVVVGPERILTAGIAVARLAAAAAGEGGPVFVIGAPALKGLVKAEGARVVEVEEAPAAAAVVVSGHRDFDYAELLASKRALDAGAALFATSRDPTLPTPEGEWPGTGAVLAAVETAAGRRAEIAGKPERHLFELALAAIPGAERVAMVGDRLSSDVAGGHAAGLATILVLSGTSGEDGAGSEDLATADPQPDFVLPDLAALLR